MTARDDQLKYDYICGLVEQTYPILAPVWQAARARFGAAWKNRRRLAAHAWDC